MQVAVILSYLPSNFMALQKSSNYWEDSISTLETLRKAVDIPERNVTNKRVMKGLEMLFGNVDTIKVNCSQ